MGGGLPPRRPVPRPRHSAMEVTEVEDRHAVAGGSAVAQRLSVDPDTVERDLIKLVLTIVELLRQLMERTALHRVDQGDLAEDEEERIGMTLMILHERMEELCERYGLTMDDLNLDLGPLGSLLPREHRNP
ncbi:gas vesicle protein K [Streptomyces virginiae]|uniref:gas vesicle protein K n=1 Tax=Streptomyces virginiae TaxID=1961 RepID=UPI0036F9D405